MLNFGMRTSLAAVGLALAATVLLAVIGAPVVSVVGTATAAVALALLAGVVIRFRSFEPAVADRAERGDAMSSESAVAPSSWCPLLGAGGAVVIAVGVVTDRFIVVAGVVLTGLTALRWSFEVHLERGGADPAAVESRHAPFPATLAAAASPGRVVNSIGLGLLIVAAGITLYGLVTESGLVGLGFLLVVVVVVVSAALRWLLSSEPDRPTPLA
ncbi:MAG: hypothetical protein ACK5OX_05825 [Desertimonas sp.]